METIQIDLENLEIPFLPPYTQRLNQTEGAILEALAASQGNLTKAARILECAYEELHREVKNSPKYTKFLDDTRLIRNSMRMDILEDLAMNLAIAGDTSMIKKLLDSHGKDRGYGERQTISIGADVPKGISDLLSGLAELRNGPQPQTNISITTGEQENKSV